ncbi:MAG: class I SAM-dependent methyltransferase [Acidobacteria bacterium]|nr:class I SAM-dependent methyltransferase [Acidobacteriota bacterium]
MSSMKEQSKNTPGLGRFARRLYWRITGNRKKLKAFPGSGKYWEQRYASGGNSGVGSYEKFAEFKAEIINSFVTRHEVISAIEFGCGDGNQLQLAHYQKYLGLDVSETAISLCKQKFASDANKTFKVMGEYEGEMGDLSLSLDVIYHLVEDEVFESYMRTLFKAASRYVIIYSSNSEDNEGREGTHVKHRNFTSWIEENASGWKIKEHVPNKYPYKRGYKTGVFADFYIYEKA